ncbi:MAG: Na/Pi cotransporter family protein [Melioribacteraceae bacterium]|nr:Na/Pi cotransporter family protein [Melioribacteraceae bacterium]
MKAFILSLTIIILISLFVVNTHIRDIAAGVAILIFGMMFLENGFKLLSSGPIEKWLRKSTNNLAKSISFGIVSTSLLQSSGLVSVVAISFLGAGMIELISGIGIIFGANIGTTTGAWLISYFGLKLNISSFALPMIVIGVLFVLQSGNKYKGIGYIISGVGFIFLGIHFMKEGFSSYQEVFDLKQYSITGLYGLIIYVSVGVITTVIMQSSHASLALVLTALSAQQISYDNALAMAIGANIGTTFTALIVSISSNYQGKRLAVAHLIFNFITAFFALLLLTHISWLVDRIALLTGISANDYIIKLSLFHSLFNILGLILILPFTKILVKFLEKAIKPSENEDISRPKYVSKIVLKYPKSAIPALLKESRHLFDNAFEIISHSINLHRKDILSDKKLKELVPKSIDNMNINIDEMYHNKIKLIFSKIIKYATIIQSYELSEKEAVLVNKIRIANRYMIEIIKHLRNLQDNFAKYSISENEFIRVEYNTLRQKIAKVMREIYKTERTDDIDSQHFKLLLLQEKAKKHDVLVNGKLDELIRERKINSGMATSLMNDSALVARICERLITIAELLFIEYDSILEIEKSASGEQLNFLDEN